MPSRITTVDEAREFEAYVEALFNSDSETDVRKELESLEVPAPYRIRVKVIYSRETPHAVFNRFAERGLLKSLKSESRTYIYETTIGRENLREVRVPFHLASFEQDNIGTGVQAIIAVCNRDQWRTLRSLVNSNYPRLAPILLSQAELIKGAKLLKQLTGHDVRVKAFSARESLSKEPGYKSVRGWTDQDLDDALLSIQDRRQTLTSLEVGFYPIIDTRTHIRPKATCKISKDGEIEATGSFRLAYHAATKHVARVGERKLAFYSERGLRESKYESRPLAINFARPIFEDIEVVRSFAHILSKYPHSMYAVEHGNPYAQVKVTDIRDGSSFDVWAIPPKRIALIPGLKASEAAFERLVHYIFDRFREGQVADYDYAERPLEVGAG